MNLNEVKMRFVKIKPKYYYEIILSHNRIFEKRKIKGNGGLLTESQNVGMIHIISVGLQVNTKSGKEEKAMNGKLRVLYTGNAGVLFIIGNKYIGVDVFSKDEEGLYPETPLPVKEKLWRLIEEKKLQFLVFTHGHSDHFCLEDVQEALRRNPRLTILSTREVIRQIREVEPAAGHLMEVPSNLQSNYKIEAAGDSLEMFYSKHMGEQYAEVDNLVCLLNLEGRKIFVPGDAWPTPQLFEQVAKWSPEIDLMAAPFPLMGIPSTRRLLAKSLKLKHVLAVHLPVPSRDDQNWLASAKAVCARSKDELPLPVFAENPGQEYYV